MSKKKIIGVILITLIALAGVVGYIGFTFTDSKVNMGISTLTDNIVQEGTIDPTYSGSITLEQQIYIYNSGVLDLKDITVKIDVFFSGSIDSAEVEVGDGVNQLGTIEAGQNESRTLTIELTNHVARLAVEDGTFRIVIDTDLQLQYIPYTVDIPAQESNEPWNAPFSPL